MLLASGAFYDIECAVLADGARSPVAEFLELLKSERWAPPGGASALTRDEQIKAHAWFVAEVEYFADTGTMHRRSNWNQLRDGIWEFKRHEVRVSFYDTDGRGRYVPKTVPREPMAGGGYCPLPEFDEFIRLGTVFEKLTARTPEPELRFARQVREEDLAHDREP
jgi:hypothetical protein